MSTTLPIASLDPATPPPSDHAVRGVVTLVWPFSSSSRQFALLLSDPDFRLRSKRGQVRVRFTGASAKAVAQKHVGIGDVVKLGLEGARWGEDREREKTPGRSVEGELVFGRRVGLRIRRDGREEEEEGEVVEVDAPASPPAEERREEFLNGQRYTEAVTPASMTSGAANGLLRRSLNGSFTDGGWTYSSPAFAKRVRLSEKGGLLDSAFDPFVDGEAGSLTKSKRSSFGTGLRWRYQSRTPSPVKDSFRDVERREEEDEVDELAGLVSPSRAGNAEKKAQGEMLGMGEVLSEGETLGEGEYGVAPILMDEGEDDTIDVDPSARQAAPLAADMKTTASQTPAAVARSTEGPPRSVAASSFPTMAPPALPQLRMPSQDPLETSKGRDEPHDAGSKGPSTPKLEPVKSPTLPLPSPFPADAPSSLSAALNFAPPPYKANSLFGSLGSAASVIERRRLSGRRSEDQLRPPQPAALPPTRKPVPEPVPTPATRPTAEKRKAAPQFPVKEAADASVVYLTDDNDKDAHTMDDVAPVQETDVNQSFSATIADGDMYDDYARPLTATMDEESEAARKRHDDELALCATEGGMLSKNDGARFNTPEKHHIDTEETRDEPVLPKESSSFDSELPNDASASQETPESTSKLPADASSLDGVSTALSSLEARSQTEVSKPVSSEHMHASSAAKPSSPTKKHPPSWLSLDGTSSTPPSTRVTRQSERERVRKNTYRNLFGLRSPQKDEPPRAAVSEPVRQEERFIPGWFFEVTAHQTDDGGSGEDAMDADRPREDSGPTKGPGPDTKDPDAPGDVKMLDGDDEYEESEHHFAGPATKSVDEHAPVAEKVKPPPKMQVIELGASSDIEDEEEAETPKAPDHVPDLHSSSPVIQDSLEISQGETVVVSEGERVAQRKPFTSATQRLKELGPGATSSLSSPLAEEWLARLATETAGVRTSATHAVQEHSLPQRDVKMELSPMPKAAELPTLELDEEEHIAPPRSTAATTVVELRSSSESEEFPSSPVVRPQQTAAQTPSYPTLPLSPSNSQSLQGMQSQPTIEESARSRLPPTPQLTQRESSLRTEERASQKTPAPKPLRSEPSLRAEVKAAESPITPQTKTPSRRSARLRGSNVPEVLSEWFSPRASGVVQHEGKAEAGDSRQEAVTEDSNRVEAAVANGHTSPGKRNLRRSQSSGFATAHSYFTPLSKIPKLLNPASQGSNTIDILAVVTDSAKEPVRAKTGPKDYFIIFRIADTSLQSAIEDSIRVEVFRPYKATLPAAEVGDIALLRGFTVKSKKRSPYLLSTDASAWCVWRYPDAGEAMKPIWTRKSKASAALISTADSVQEEIKGPPVEFGAEERNRARGLREWWVEHQRESGREDELAAKL